jgi:hypothetical protein
MDGKVADGEWSGPFLLSNGSGGSAWTVDPGSSEWAIKAYIPNKKDWNMWGVYIIRLRDKVDNSLIPNGRILYIGGGQILERTWLWNHYYLENNKHTGRDLFNMWWNDNTQPDYECLMMRLGTKELAKSAEKHLFYLCEQLFRIKAPFNTKWNPASDSRFSWPLI